MCIYFVRSPCNSATRQLYACHTVRFLSQLMIVFIPSYQYIFSYLCLCLFFFNKFLFSLLENNDIH